MKGYLSGKAKLVVCAMFFLSGATALFYEVLWARLLHLVFGDTLLAVSTVLAAFMAGLALGSYLLGRWIDARPRAGLRLYAALEIGIGGYALLVPLMLQWLTPVCTLAIEHYRASFYLLGLIRFGISFLLLLPPTTLMGGSLPVLIRYLAGHRSEAGGIAGTLYAVNTLGAVVGCLLPSFVLIGVFGIQHTIYGAAAVNLLAGLMALILDWASAAPAVPPAAPESAPAAGESPELCPPRLLQALPWLYAVAGFTGLAYEVLWTRLLVLMTALDVHGFAMMLAVVLTGIGLGSLLSTRFLARRSDKLAWLVMLEVLIGVWAVASIWLFRLLPPLPMPSPAAGLLAPPLPGPGGGVFPPPPPALVALPVSVVLVLIPTLAMGCAFPLVVSLCARGLGRLGSSIGALYGLNTAGAILGSLAGGFLLVPWLGLQSSMLLLGLLNLAIAAVIVLLGPALRRQTLVRRTAFAAAVCCPLFFGLYGRPSARPLVAAAGDSWRVLHYHEGLSSSGRVLEDVRTGAREVYLDSLPIAASDYRSLRVLGMLAHLPMLLHEDPQRVLIVGFGSGCTSGMAAQYGARVDCVELDAGERESAALFKHVNHDVLNRDLNPRFALHVDDGRNWLLTRSASYDVISRDSLMPSVSQDLYSREFYDLCRRRLRPGGVICGYLPLDGEGFLKRSVVTLRSVCPHLALWYVYPQVCLLLGSDRPWRIDYQRLAARMSEPRIRRDLETIRLADPCELLAQLLMVDDDLLRYAGGCEPFTDDKPLGYQGNPGFSGPQALRPMLDDLLAHRSDVLPLLHHLGDSPAVAAGVKIRLRAALAATVRLMRAEVLLTTAALEAALEELAALGPGQPGGAEAGVQSAMLLAAMAEQKLRRSEPREALALLTRALRHGPEMAYLQVMRGRICERLGDLPEARRAYRKSREISDRLSQPPIPLAVQRLAELPAAD